MVLDIITLLELSEIVFWILNQTVISKNTVLGYFELGHV